MAVRYLFTLLLALVIASFGAKLPQVNFIKTYLDFADIRDFITGMHVWAFSDFKTGQGIIRFGR